MAANRHFFAPPVVSLLLLIWIWSATVCSPALAAAAAADVTEFRRDGKVIELDDTNFEAAVSAFDYLFVDFYAPWCGHCKRLAPELDVAAPMLKEQGEPIVIAKVNADKYRKLGSKYEVDGFPTLKLFIHGVPIEYTGSRKADVLVRNLRKYVAPDVSFLESDSAIRSFVETAGTNFPLFVGFGLNESVIAEYGSKYKKKAWFSVAKDFTEEMMVFYDFDKIPALVSLHPKYDEQSVFYGPFEGNFVEDFIKQSLMPLTLPINSETLRLLNDDKRKVVLTILADDSDEKSMQLVKVLRSAARANRDLVFAYVGVKQWEVFADTFDVSTSSKLPKMVVWDRNEEYELVEGSETLEDDDPASQISRFLEGYREGRTTKKRVSGPSFTGFIKSLMDIKTVYIIIFLVGILMLLSYFGGKGAEEPRTRRVHEE